MPRSNQADGRLVSERYRLTGQLGSGGMGTVWKGWDERLKRGVAVKEVVIPDGLPPAEADNLRTRYLREARAAARLRHPSVVGVYDVIPEARRVWIVMELVEARDLAAILAADGTFPPARAARIGLQLLDALDAAHEAGVLHRDVKPANVLICPDERAVLTDFGVASVTGDTSLTRTGQLVGSPAYLAPERVTGGKIGPPTDLWSLGCTLYAAVEGAAPYARGEQYAIIAAITLEPIPPPRSAGLLTPILYGLLEKEPGARWDSARTRLALERVVAGRTVDRGTGWGAPARGTPQVPAPREPPPRTGDYRTTDHPITNRRAPVPPVTRTATTRVVAPRGPDHRQPATGQFGAVAERTASAATVSQPVPQPPGVSWGAIIAVLLLVAAAILGGILTVTLVNGRDRSPGAAAADDRAQVDATPVAEPSTPVVGVVPGAQASPSALPAAGASPSPAGAGSKPSAPPAFRTVTNTALGYRVAVPGAWSEVCPRDGDACRYNALTGDDRLSPQKISATANLLVRVAEAAAAGAVALAQDEEATRIVDDERFPGYARVRLDGAATNARPDASLLEYTYDNPANGSKQHVAVYRAVVGGRSYEVTLDAPDSGFGRGRKPFEQAIATLQPAIPS